MPLLNDETGPVLAYLRPVRRNVYAVPAAGQGHSQAAKDGTSGNRSGCIQGLFPPAGGGFGLSCEVILDIPQGVLADDGESLFSDSEPSVPLVGF